MARETEELLQVRGMNATLQLDRDSAGVTLWVGSLAADAGYVDDQEPQPSGGAPCAGQGSTDPVSNPARADEPLGTHREHLSTDRARLEAEGWCFDFPPEGETGEEHELLLDEISSCAGDPKTGWKYLGEDHGFYEWRHPTRPGRLPAMGDAGCSVLAWRRLAAPKPIATSPAAGLEAVKAEVAELRAEVDRLSRLVEANESFDRPRLDELELQGLVVRRLIDKALPDYEDTLKDIEREERERAGK